MALLKTRIIVSAVVFAANLSLSYGSAEAQAPPHGTSQASGLHRMRLAERPTIAAEAGSMAMPPETSMNYSSDYPEFRGFSGLNAC